MVGPASHSHLEWQRRWEGCPLRKTQRQGKCKVGLPGGWEAQNGGAWRPISGMSKTHPSTDLMKAVVA